MRLSRIAHVDGTTIFSVKTFVADEEIGNPLFCAISLPDRTAHGQASSIFEYPDEFGLRILKLTFRNKRHEIIAKNTNRRRP